MAETQGNESTKGLQQKAQHAEALQAAIAPDAAIVARPVRRYRARLFQTYLVVATVSLALLFVFAGRVAYFSFDLSIAHWVQHWHTFWLDVMTIAVSQLGFTPMAPIFVIATLLFVFLIGLKWEAVMLLVASAGVGVLDMSVKVIVQRHRPTADLVNIFSVLNDYSFPSGHVLLFTVFLGFLLFLTYTLTSRSWVRTCGLSCLGMLIALVGLSRVYLGQHWPSDVIGAYLLGSLWLTLTIYLYRKGKPRFFVHQPLAPGKPKTGK